LKSEPEDINQPATRSLRIWVVAGEASGDARASELMRELRRLQSGITFHGSGGPLMQPLATPPFDNWIAEAGVVGLWDVLRHYPYFRHKFHTALREIRAAQPDAVILVDYPGFNLRLAKALRQQNPGIRLIYYISPQVWAWNRGRIPKMAKLLDLMICIFPFEKALYESSGLPTVFAGHPLVDELNHEPKTFPREEDLLAFFPGSREREIKRLFPVMLQAAKRVRKSRPEIRFAAAAARPGQADWMKEQAEASGVAIEILTERAHELMQSATAGIVCSGTATLEATFFRLPYCLAYRINWLTYEVGRRVVTIPYLGIANILAGKPVVRELIQKDCTPAALADEALRLLNNPEARQNLQAELDEVISSLGGSGAAEKAAKAVLAAGLT